MNKKQIIDQVKANLDDALDLLKELDVKSTLCVHCGKLKVEHSEKGYCDNRFLNEDGSDNANFQKFSEDTKSELIPMPKGLSKLMDDVQDTKSEPSILETDIKELMDFIKYRGLSKEFTNWKFSEDRQHAPGGKE